MIQTTLSVPLEVRPESADRLSALINKFKRTEDNPGDVIKKNFARLAAQIPTLHFMSLSVFEDAAYDPIFVIEVNFDGPPGPLWNQLNDLAGNKFREMLRCCKKPLDDDAKLYDKVTAHKSTSSVARYLTARTQRPSVFHHGNRGLTKDQIVKEAKLFKAIREELDAPENQGPTPYRGVTPLEILKKLREKLEPSHTWLADAAPTRIPRMESLGDYWHLLFYLSCVLLAFALPGILAAILLEHSTYLTAVISLGAIAVVFVIVIRKPLKNTDVTTDFRFIKYVPIILLFLAFPVVVLIIAGVGFVALVDPFINVIQGEFTDWWWLVAKTIILGQLSLLFTIPAIVLWLRYLERRDSSHSSPPIDADKIADMAKQEDWVSQNHMGSIVNLRPGVLRTVIVKAGHRGLGLLLRIQARNGYLGSMRTVHFAHWAFLNNGSRLIFLSNFDQSWGSYLDDFIEKAHVGLTLAWGCGVGFPTTRFLLFDGASHGRLFKNWALASRTTSRFWYSAYPDLSVDQIERNHRIANGLRHQDTDDGDALEWVRLL